MRDFPRSREPKPLWSSCFLISPALQDKKFVGNLIRVHYQHEKKQCEVHSIFFFSIFFFQTVVLNQWKTTAECQSDKNPLNNWSVTKYERDFDRTWLTFHKKKGSHTWLDDIYFNIRWQIDSSVSFLWFCSSIRIGLRHFETILRHFLEQTEN